MNFNNDILIVKNKRKTFLFNTADKKEYALNEHGYRIIEAIKNKEQIKTTLSHKVSKFINYLLKEKILTTKKNKNSQVCIKTSNLEPALERVFIELTSECDQACKHCYMNASYCGKDESTPELSLDKIRHIIDTAHQHGVWRFDLTGGEVFLRKDIFDVLNYLKKRFMVVNIFTNGTLLNIHKIKKLSTYWNVKKVIVSLDGHNAPLHDSFRGVRGSFDKTVDALKTLEKCGVKTAINVSLSKQNYMHAKDIAGFIAENFRASYMLSPFLSTGRGYRYGEENFVPVETYADILKRIFKMKSRSYRKNYHSINNFCGVGEEFIFINNAGEVYICPSLTARENKELYMGSFFDHNLAELWEKNELLNRFRKTQCMEYKTCSYFDKCLGGCRSRAYLNSGNNFCGRDLLACAFFRVEDKTFE